MVAFGCLPKNFGRWRGPMNGTLLSYECNFSLGDTLRWWRHSTPTCCNIISFCPHMQWWWKNILLMPFVPAHIVCVPVLRVGGDTKTITALVIMELEGLAQSEVVGTCVPFIPFIPTHALPITSLQRANKWNFHCLIFVACIWCLRPFNLLMFFKRQKITSAQQ